MDNIKQMQDAMRSMELHSDLYKPTQFWKDATMEIAASIENSGFNSFRSLTKCLDYFVPTYGSPGNGFESSLIDSLSNCIKNNQGAVLKNKLSLEMFLSGYSAALADYRVFLAADDKDTQLNLSNFSESDIGNPKEQFTIGGQKFSRSALNYILGLCFLKKHIDSDFPKVVLEIGGGFGSLGEILTSTGENKIKYIDVDIPPVSSIAQFYLEQTLGHDNVAGFNKTSELDQILISSLPTASILVSHQIEKLQGTVDLFVNFISFQEMEPHVVQNYIKHIKRLNSSWVLLRNLREGKNVSVAGSVGVKKPIRTDDYVQMLFGYELVATSVHPFGYETVDEFNSELLLFKKINPV